MIDHEFVVPKRKTLPKNLIDNPLASPSLSMIIGGTGSGKSTCTANLLMALQKLYDFDSALFVTGNSKDPLLDSLEMPITTSPVVLSEWLTRTKNAPDETRHLLVLDDIQGNPDFNVFMGRSEFTQFILSHRHFGESKEKDGYGTWVIVTAQTLANSFSTSYRAQVKNYFIYYPRVTTNMKLYEGLAKDPKEFRHAMEMVKTEGKFAFMFLNKHEVEKDRYFLGFNRELKHLI